MSSITTIQSTDLISGSRTDINTNFSNLNSDKIETSTLDTDTTLAANSDSKIATQKATKAYVDASVNPTGRSWNEYAVDSVGSDSYAITVSGISAYVAGQTYKFKAGTANTGACTLNVNALGAKTIKKDVSSDLSTGDILTNQLVVVTYDGTNMQLVGTPPSPIPIVRTYLNAGSPATWTKPAGLKYVVVEVQAGGGGGGASDSTNSRAGAGGGGGGFSKKTIAVASLGATETVTTGAGGAGGVTVAGTGTTGSSSSFGTHATATGGGGGTAGGTGVGGVGGVGSSGDINTTGGAGVMGNNATDSSGAGGSSMLGGGGKGVSGTTAGNTGGVYGGGGSGGSRSSGSNSAGGDGAAGIVIVTEYY